MPLVFGLSLFLLAAAAVSGGAGGGLKVRFIGNMAFAISDGQTTLWTDFPYESGAFGYQSWQDADLAMPERELFVLFTHAHRDHFDPALKTEQGWKGFGPAEVLSALPEGKRTDLAALAARGIRVTPLTTPHAHTGHFSYVIDWKGVRIYHSGDTEDPATLLAQKGLDLVLVSHWLLSAANRQGKVDAKRILVCHVGGSDLVRNLPPGASVAIQGSMVRIPS